MHNISSPATSDEAIERRLAGSPGPRVTPAAIKANIASEHYFTAAQGVAGRDLCAEDDDDRAGLTTNSPLHLLTICVLVLQNGFSVVGKSACASPENFNPKIGRDLAYEDAVRQVWPLMGYHLKQCMHTGDDYK